MKKNNKNKKGFSFIELMITIAIMGIMTTITLVSMNKGRELWAVKTAAREVAATVRETQNNALTGKGLKDQTTSCVFRFRWVVDSSNYFMEDCKDQSYVLKNGVTFSNLGSITFEVPFSMLSGSTRTITVKKGASAYNICVYVSGAVKEAAGVCPAS
jgi:prepilin-type N-terminal cleavage/methylation domain-containing protein